MCQKEEVTTACLFTRYSVDVYELGSYDIYMNYDMNIVPVINLMLI